MSSPHRPVVPLMRLGFLLGVGLSATAGASLFFLSADTDRWFAWTIGVPLTAAFLGSFYFLAVGVAYLSSRRRTWANARVGVPGVLVFLWATGVATLLHLDQFHLDDGPGPARVAAWVWLVVYVVDPIVFTLGFALELRAPGVDPPREHRFPSWYRAVAAAVGAVTALYGVALFVAPARMGEWWAWPLTPLTGRMVAAWVMAAGVVLVTIAWEDDGDRARPAALSLIGFGVLELVTLARFSEDFDSAWTGLLYAGSALFAIAIGLAGLGARKTAAGRGKTALAAG